jgi:hypothetical protein
MKTLILDIQPDIYGFTDVLYTEKWYNGSFAVNSLTKISDLNSGMYGAGTYAGINAYGYYPGVANPIVSPGYQQPLVSQTGDYLFDQSGNLITTRTPAIERIVLILKTKYGSQSTNLGLKLPPVLDTNYKQLIKSSLDLSLKGLILDGSISNVNYNISKDKSVVKIQISFTDNYDKSNQTLQYKLYQ